MFYHVLLDEKKHESAISIYANYKSPCFLANSRVASPVAFALRQIPGGSHFMLVEDPARFAADVLAFIGR